MTIWPLYVAAAETGVILLYVLLFGALVSLGNWLEPRIGSLPTAMTVIVILLFAVASAATVVFSLVVLS